VASTASVKCSELRAAPDMTRSSSSLDGANMPHAAVKAEPQQPDSLEEEDSELMGEDSEAEDDEGFETYQTAEMGELGDQDL
jgi:hypothetical protein